VNSHPSPRRNKEEHQEILHEIRIFERKFEVMCQMVFDIKIIVSKVAEDVGKVKHVEASSSIT
jgi:hypothetical protein